jgi:hypothetical protein
MNLLGKEILMGEEFFGGRQTYCSAFSKSESLPQGEWNGEA